MGVEDTVGRGIFHKTTLKHRGTVFSIGNRGDVLTSQLEAPIIVPHTATKTRVNMKIKIYWNKIKYININIIIPSYLQYHYEALFRSEQYALVDNACREYLFLTEFFKVRGVQAMDIFNQVILFFILILV